MIITTGLKGKKYYDILASVMGQLSDGIWENSNSNQRYWQNQSVEFNKETQDIVIKSNWLFNNEMACLKFFANKVKQIVKIEREDGSSDLKWDRNNSNETTYISPYGHYENGQYVQAAYSITVGDCYFVYDYLLGRDTKKFTYAHGEEEQNVA